MSRRREANRIEAIVRAVGALFLLLVLAVFIKLGPGLFKGKTSAESLSIALKCIYVFLFLCAVVSVIALIAWWRVMRKPGASEPQTYAKVSEIACPDCGRPMVLRTGKLGKFYGCPGYPACKGRRPFSRG